MAKRNLRIGQFLVHCKDCGQEYCPQEGSEAWKKACEQIALESATPIQITTNECGCKR